jgi:tetratricopeptide (TPR) repeat protein
MAVVSFHNLTGDPSLDWEGPALAGIIAYEVSASNHIYPFRVDDLREARQGEASRYLEGYYEKIGDGVVFHLSIENASTHKFVSRMEMDTGADAALLNAADNVADSLDRRKRKFSTQKPTAIHDWGEALVNPDAGQRIAWLKKAIAADPNFGLAYIDLAQALELSGDRTGAAAAIRQGALRGTMLTDYDQARLDGMQGALTGDLQERRTALKELSRLVTTDPVTLESMAQIEYSTREFVAAADHYKSALALDPTNTAVLNQLGYAEAFNGDLDSATGALDRYRNLAPKDPNALDSLGEVHFFLGRFADAERYFLEAAGKGGPTASAELIKAAQARLMEGNLEGADALSKEWAAQREALHDPAVAVNRAQWLYITGRQKQAIAALQPIADGQPGDIASYAAAHLVFWYLSAGDRSRAQEYASKATATANPALHNLGTLCRFISIGRADAGAWNIAAGQAFPDPSRAVMRRTALAYALLFSKDFSTAAMVLRPLYQQTGPNDDGLMRTLYAWALVASNHPLEAAPLVTTYPLPIGNGEPLFSSLSFPRFLALRAAVRSRQGLAKQARADLDLYRKYAGDMPSIFAAPSL